MPNAGKCASLPGTPLSTGSTTLYDGGPAAEYFVPTATQVVDFGAQAIWVRIEAPGTGRVVAGTLPALASPAVAMRKPAQRTVSNADRPTRLATITLLLTSLDFSRDRGMSLSVSA